MTALLHRRSRHLLTLGLTLMAGVMAAACSSGGGSAATTTTTTSPASSPATTASPQVVVKTQNISGFGNILVNSQGQVLYSFTNNGAPVPCSATCLTLWPAVTLPTGVTTPTGSPGVGTLATTKANGPTQVTVDGLPLFTFAGDSGPGVVKGNNLVSFGGTWKVVKAQ